VSIGPRHIDRHGERPCIPQLALLAAMRAAAEGRPPSLVTRIRKTLAALARKIAR
jgi:hypothetical protein